LALAAQVEVILPQSLLLLVTQVEVLLALEVLLAQAVQVIQAEVDSLGVLLVSQVFNDGYTDIQLEHRWCIPNRMIESQDIKEDDEASIEAKVGP
jgi:hypothetical protein